jgi:hypothetical protein
MHVIREGANAVLCDNPHTEYTKEGFGDAVSNYLGRLGNKLASSTLVKDYWPDLIAEGYPGFNGKRFAFIPGVREWKGQTPETIAAEKAKAKRARTFTPVEPGGAPRKFVPGRDNLFDPACAVAPINGAAFGFKPYPMSDDGDMSGRPS